ncbi:MAG: double-strand break repair protein AddB, partial [Shimia sp.]|uniref:double-strand break repair protein AddB n=1 Tax=Shimia sp. TaxID=1954381 RepID=UPI004057F527
MFDPADTARVFGVPPGADFPRILVDGLRHRMTAQPPELMAQVEVIVNTSRMARRVSALFDDGTATLLPRIRLLGDFSRNVAADLPPAAPPLRQRFELIQLITRLLEQQPDLASRASIYDLADSLAGLFDEMAGEGVTVEAIESLDVSDQSGHWARAQHFFAIARHFLDNVDSAPGKEARQRIAIERLAQKWETTPPNHPVILAGSTGSRGTMMLLMQAVAKLPQGAIVLPGYDTDMPNTVWHQMSDALEGEDHPQFRFRKLMDTLSIGPQNILPWLDCLPPSPSRNRLVSLAMRPAPVTDQWLTEGPKLGDLMGATQDITLIEATTQREEALAIAARMRKASDDGQTCALISPDRMLTRQVSAALDRWRIVPDDSAGQPLQLSPPGRFLRHVSTLFQRNLTSEALLTLLKHPLTHSAEGRGEHLLMAHKLELWIRRKAVTYPDPIALRQCGDGKDGVDADWIEWVIAAFCDKDLPGEVELSDRLDAHITLAEQISTGQFDGETTGGLWQERAGIKAAKVVADLREHAPVAGPITASDYADLFGAVLAREEVRDRDQGHPHILVWGTLEARVQGADLVILGGLNEGSWPEAPSPDPWLNRKMRHDAGLLLPERRIGLSAHDFQQAVCASEVWITRAIRTDEAETVPSRWVNRLLNLLGGLPEQNGPEALADMRARGQIWIDHIRALETFPETPAAQRPSPVPPSAAQPRKLSVTEIKRLIRDPYAIYAKHVLRLRPMDPLMRTPDALLRGIIVHEILELLIKESVDNKVAVTRERLLEISETVLAQNVPWPTARVLWKARLERIADHVVTEEAKRRLRAT